MKSKSFEELTAGYTNIGADKYSGKYWSIEKRQQRPVVFSSGNQQLLRLPNGDLMQIHCGVSWSRWTKKRDVIENFELRAAIKGWKYSPELTEALCVAEMAGASRNGICSYLGGTVMVDGFRKTNFRDNFYKGHAKTGMEEIVTARKFFREIQAEKQSQLVDKILELLVPGSIVEVY